MVSETEDLEDILIGIVVYCKRRKTWIGLGEVFFLSFFFWILFVVLFVLVLSVVLEELHNYIGMRKTVICEQPL